MYSGGVGVDGKGKVGLSAQMHDVYGGQISSIATFLYIDGDASNASFSHNEVISTPSGPPNSFEGSWQIPSQFVDGQEHVLYAYVGTTCQNNFFLVNMDGSPATFTLAP